MPAVPVLTTDPVPQLVTELTAVVGDLGPSDRLFAKSLLDYFGKKGTWSPSQHACAARLVRTALLGDGPVIDFDLGLLLDRFKYASGHIKYPKLFLSLSSGERVRLARGGAQSAVPGCVNLTNDFSYPNTWFGRVSSTEGIKWGGAATEEYKKLWVPLLRGLCEDFFAVPVSCWLASSECSGCGKFIDPSKANHDPQRGMHDKCAQVWCT